MIELSSLRRGTSPRSGFPFLCMALAAAVLSVAAPALATSTERWIHDTAEDFLKGEGDGVAVHPEGRLAPVASWSAAQGFEEPVVLAGDVAADGSFIVGTGHPARLYSVSDSKHRLLAEVPAEQITALLVAGDGSLVVATMAPGALFRWQDGDLEEIGRLGEGAFWDLAQFGNDVVAAAGPPAALYRIGSGGLERWVDLPDSFVRCLFATESSLLLGTSGKGMIMSVDGSGRMALLSDSTFTEISDLTLAPDGSVWATALVGEPPPKKKSANTETSGNGTTETSTMEIDLPKVNGATATSEVLRLTPEGALLRVHRFTKQVASALQWDGEGVLVGTGYEGEVWRFVNSGGSRLASVDAVQVVSILGDGAALLTQGPTGVLHRQKRPERARYRVDALHLERPVRFGEFRVLPTGDGVKIRFRSGVAKDPDPTWMPWTDWLSASGEVVPLPPSRSMQWEIDLDSRAGEGVSVERVEVAYREINVAPVVKSVTVEEPGVVFLSAPPPSGPVIDLRHPDVSGIFSVIDEKAKKKAKNNKGKKYWRTGYRTVGWEAVDVNGDPLRYRLEAERVNGQRLMVREDLKSTQIGVDTSAVPDGRYRFRVTASDGEANPGQAKEGSSIGRWFVVDNGPPRVKIERRGDHWSVTVEDELSPLVKVEWSRDGERWRGMAPTDGILDGTVEHFEIAAEAGAHFVVVRAIDRQHNRATAGVEEE